MGNAVGVAAPTALSVLAGGRLVFETIRPMEMPASGLPQGTVTFVFTDIEGSTDLARRHGANFGRVRSEHRRVLREAFGRHEGHEIDTAGDAFFVVFERAGDALAAAVEAQRALAGTPDSVSVRIGLHSAEPYLDEEGYVGVGVHRAARICAAGHGGEILLSNATAGIVEDLGIEGVKLRDLGEYRLKDIERPQRLFQAVVHGLESEFPPLKSLDTARSPSAATTLLYADVMGWRGVLQSIGDERSAVVVGPFTQLAGGEMSRGGGRVLEAVADRVLGAFEKPLDAVHAATRLRESLQSEPSVSRRRASRGANGDPLRTRGRLTGRAHRLGLPAPCVGLCHGAEAWQILMSHATEALLEGELSDVALNDLGERTVESFDRPAHVFEVL